MKSQLGLTGLLLLSTLIVAQNVIGNYSCLILRFHAGVVARDQNGSFVAARRYRLSVSCVVVTEALSILHGCELGISLGLNSVIIESDSLESISCLRDTLTNGSWEAFPTLVKSKKLGESFQDCH